MNASKSRVVVLACLAILTMSSAYGFGVAGHSVASAVAESHLCVRAREAVARLSGGQSLAELSRWADQIRYVSAWEHTAPWHYMNIPDNEPLARHRTPERGDVLWAINEFTQRLGDESLTPEDRADALRFVVHFVVDIHQPLHVGRLEDRGGNAISFRIDGQRTNLHRLWDSGIIARDSGSPDRYVDSVMALADANAADWHEAPPREWAQESQRLRAFVYDFEDVPGPGYLDEAGRVLRQQLARAGVRLAVTLNRIYCEYGAAQVAL
jgi:hypothetical protein